MTEMEIFVGICRKGMIYVVDVSDRFLQEGRYKKNAPRYFVKI